MPGTQHILLMDSDTSPIANYVDGSAIGPLALLHRF